MPGPDSGGESVLVIGAVAVFENCVLRREVRWVRVEPGVDVLGLDWDDAAVRIPRFVSNKWVDRHRPVYCYSIS